MTIPDGSPTYKERGHVAEEEWKSSKSSTSSSEHNPAFETSSLNKPMNLILKSRLAASRQKDFRLERTATKSTTRTSFTTHTFSTNYSGLPPEEECVTVTDDGPVEDLRQEDVYKKLSKLAIVPPQNDKDIPKVVATPSPTETRRSNASTKSTDGAPSITSASVSSFHTAPEKTLPAAFKQSNGGEQVDSSSNDDDDDSAISDITGNFTRQTIDEEPSFVIAHRETESPPPLPFSEQHDKELEHRAQTLLQVAAAKATSNKRRNASRVSFSTVCIREYERILGDNPSVTCGPPLGIGWNYYEDEEILSINEWESWRETEREPERLVLGREEREELLLDLGYSRQVIAQAVRDIIKVKNKRRQTITNLGASGIEEVMESASRKVKKLRKGKGILSLGKKKRRNKDDESEESSLCA